MTQYKMKLTPEYETWINRTWRPLIALQYVLVCLFDFIIAPVITFAFFYYTGGQYVQWSPITLTATGLYHLAMGAVLGVTSWQRSEEKKALYSADGAPNRARARQLRAAHMMARENDEDFFFEDEFGDEEFQRKVDVAEHRNRMMQGQRG